MTRIFLVVCLALIAICGRADIGVSYCMKGTLVMKDGSTLKGYFQFGTYELRIEKDDKGWYYYRNEELLRLQSGLSGDPIKVKKSDLTFRAFVKEQLVDSVHMYTHLVLLQANTIFGNTDGRIPVFGDRGQAAAVSNIKHIVINEVYFTYPGMGSDSKCSQQDLKWIDQPVIGREDLGNAMMCEFTAVLFEPKGSEVETLFLELKAFYARAEKMFNGSENYSQQEYDEMNQLILSKVEELRKHHVLVLSSCSC